MSTTCCHLPSSFLLSWPFLICLQGTILLFSYSVALSLSPSLTLSPVFSLAAILPPHSFLSQLKLAQHHCRCVSSFVSLKVACIQLSLLFLFRHLLPLIYLFWVFFLFLFLLFSFFQQSPVTSQTSRQCPLTPAKMAPSPSPTPSSPALQTSSSSSSSSSSSCPALRPVRQLLLTCYSVLCLALFSFAIPDNCLEIVLTESKVYLKVVYKLIIDF